MFSIKILSAMERYGITMRHKIIPHSERLRLYGRYIELRKMRPKMSVRDIAKRLQIESGMMYKIIREVKGEQER